MKAPLNFAVKRPNRFFLAPLIVIALLILYVIFALTRPLPAVNATSTPITAPETTTQALTWPPYGQMAVGIQGYGVLATNGEQKSVPIASVAKTMVALSILEKFPLKAGEQGPTLTLTETDVDIYKKYIAQNGSVVAIQAGEQLTEYQLLQALLLPSGNNIAETLANWAYGSVDTYLAHANDQAKAWGLAQTRFVDPSGQSAETVSSARDLLLLGQKMLEQPVLADIVKQSEVTLPVAGKSTSTNWLLGQDGVIGIKTGHTDESGGCFLFAFQNNLGAQNTPILGVVLGAPSISTALHDMQSFIGRNKANFALVTAAKQGQTVGTYTAPWGAKSDVVAKQDAVVPLANGQKITTKTDLPALKGKQAKDTEVGTLLAETGQATVKTPLVLSNAITSPPVWWRLLHP